MPRAKMAPVSFVREEGGLFKYVRMSNDELRFVTYGDRTPEHRDMVDNGEVAKSGGTVGILADRAKIMSKGSLSLDLPTLPDDEALITLAIFGVS